VEYKVRTPALLLPTVEKRRLKCIEVKITLSRSLYRSLSLSAGVLKRHLEIKTHRQAPCRTLKDPEGSLVHDHLAPHGGEELEECLKENKMAALLVVIQLKVLASTLY